jgi:hypothetical protein
MGKCVKLICQSLTCRRQVEMEVPTGSEPGRVSHPRCACGSEMKKTYSKPAFRILAKTEAMLRAGDYEPRTVSGESADCPEDEL